MRLPNQSKDGDYMISVASRKVSDAVAPSHLCQVAQFNPIVQRVLPLLGLLHGHTKQVRCELRGSTVVPGSPCWECSDEYGLSTGPMCFSPYPPTR